MAIMTVETDQTIFRFGTQSLKCTTGTTGDNAIYPSGGITVVPGEYRSFSIYVRTNAPITGGSIYLRIAQAGLLTPVLAESDPITDSSMMEDVVNGFGRLTLTFLVPDGVTSIRPFVQYSGSTGSQVFWLDGVKLETGDVASEWQPNLVSERVVHDPMGSVIDGSAGGIFRLRGSTGGSRDTVSLGAKGLTFGGDTDLYADAANVLHTPDSLQVDGSLSLSSTRDVYLSRAAANTLQVDTNGAGAGTAIFKVIGRIVQGLVSTAAAVITEAHTVWDDTLKALYVGDSVNAKPVTPVSFQLTAAPIGLQPTDASGAALSLAAVSGGNGGTVVVPIAVTSPMVLDAYLYRSSDTASARSCELRLYYNKTNDSNSWTYFPGSAAADSFTPGAASTRTVALTGGAIVLPPGQYLLALRNTSSSQTFGLVRTAATVIGARMHMTKSIAALGATIDIVTATWTGSAQQVHTYLRGQYNGNSWS